MTIGRARLMAQVSIILVTQMAFAEIPEGRLKVDEIMSEKPTAWASLLEESASSLDNDFFSRHVLKLRSQARMKSDSSVRECNFLYTAAVSVDRADAALVALEFNKDLESQCYLGVMLAEDSFRNGDYESAYSDFAALAKDLYRPSYCHFRMAEIRFLQGDYASVKGHFQEANRYETQIATSKLALSDPG